MKTQGYKTSEFWFTLVSFIFSGLFLAGVITESDTKDTLITVVTHAVQSIILIGGQSAIFYRYIQGRNKEKASYEHRRELEDYIGVDREYSTININTASMGELIQLPHIGPSIAEKIIQYREKTGGFDYIEQMIDINGIGGSTYKDIQPYITLH
tara:strand:+ start:1381 stop:1842 length:462 start_codon:yes stop_codon:yes gene_type:complete